MLDPELLAGYRRFRDHGFKAQRARWAELAQGQAPRTMVIGCADSRVDPAQVFDCAPGELFVIRNVANLVPPYDQGGGLHGVSAAIEFAVLGLKVANIVVLGHAACGGINAALNGHDLAPAATSFITAWMGIVTPARDAVVRAAPADPQRALEYAAIRLSLANLREFPFVRDREAAGALALHGAHFGIADGELGILHDEVFVAA